jgi:hypothetical protein
MLVMADSWVDVRLLERAASALVSNQDTQQPRKGESM